MVRGGWFGRWFAAAFAAFVAFVAFVAFAVVTDVVAFAVVTDVVVLLYCCIVVLLYGLYGWTGTPFIYMRNQKAHAGFPEISYGKFSSILVNAGYKVARVEQVNKADGKLVNRAVVTIITPGK